jgi:hypothetical protein
MNTVNIETPTVDTSLRGFLQRHDAEPAFAALCDLVRESFPDARAIEAFLWEDPDEEDRSKAMLRITLPPSQPPELLRNRRGHYYDQLTERLPLSQLPLFGLLLDFASA